MDGHFKTVHVTADRDREILVVPYDQLVVALGQVVDLSRTPAGRPCAGDEGRPRRVRGIRNQSSAVEEADTAADARRKRRLLAFVVVGGGFTGVETLGEMQELIHKSLRHYPHPPGRGKDRPHPAWTPHSARVVGTSRGLCGRRASPARHRDYAEYGGRQQGDADRHRDRWRPRHRRRNDHRGDRQYPVHR